MEPASPLLPWEVIERVIGHSGDDRQSLINFSLTCPALRPRALCLLVADIRFQRREQIFNFCDFLQAKPHLKPLVRSIAVDPDEFSPFPLLSILPSLPKLNFRPNQLTGPDDRTATVLNRSILTCCERFGTLIQALHIYNLSFATYLDFSRVILAFKNLTELVCARVLMSVGGNQVSLDVLKRHLPAVHLRTVNINYLHLGTEYFYDRLSVASLLLDTGLVRSTVETLTVRPYRSYGLSYRFYWPRLRLLVLEPSFSATEIAATTVFLEGFPSSIQDVRVQFRDGFTNFFIETLSDEAVPGHLKALEQALLRFRRPRIACLIYALSGTGDSFWIQEIGQYFPELLQRGAFTMTPGKGPVVPRAGHCLKVSDIATSPDGKWVATSSYDSTIILWRTTDGGIAKQWVAHSYKAAISLAFSPDSQYLVSGGKDSKVKIWDVAEGSREAITLEGHTKPVTCCAWSPRDDLVASGSDDQSVRLWDAHAFHALHVLEHPDGHSIRIVAFSPDGSWLASGTLHGYRLWNTASGTLHKSLPDEFLTVYPYLAPARNQAVFDLRSGTRLLVTDSNRRVKVVDVETGEERAVLTDCQWSGAQGVSQISPDGTLVLTNFSDGRVMLLDAYTGVELLWLKGHEQPVRWACFSPCGKYVASLLKDDTIRLWRARDGSCMETFSSRDLILVAMGFSADGKTLWLGDSRGTVTMWRTRDVFQTEKRVL